MQTENLKVIGFDADDTLWVNEPYYRETEERFCQLLREYGTKELISKKLLQIEVKNLGIYGYGTKAFMLSLIETALSVSENKIQPEIIGEIIALGKLQICRRNEILPGAEKVLKELSGKYRLILATKGDLLDQERKLSNSGLLGYFHHIEIMSDKKIENYRQLLNHLDILPSEFLMVGNSMKSDILPVLELGGNAIHIPFHTTWIFEDVVGTNLDDSRFTEVELIEEILRIL
jgi:putative hydrolase of the HAD superfamily